MSERRLRVLHVATLVTPDGAYGGPVRVAVNQVRALRERGHDALLVAGAAGFGDSLPDTWDGAPVRLFRARRTLPGLGFAGTVAPGMRTWIRRHSARFDVAHVHLARDLVTLPAALAWMRTGKPFVTQTHGMVMPSSRLAARPVDALGTRPVLNRARVALHLTEQERHGLLDVAGSRIRLDPLAHGIPGAPPTTSPETRVEVLFLARLHPRKRPLDFVRAAGAVAREVPDAEFVLVGPDEGEGTQVRDAIRRLPDDIRPRVRWEGSIAPDAVLARMSRCAVYVLPARDEPFGMTVLEAMFAGRPVIVTNECGLAPAVEEAGAGIVVRSPDDLAGAMRHLLAHPDLRRRMGSRGAELAKQRFTMATVVDQLERSYALPARPGSRPAGSVHRSAGRAM